MNRKYKEFVRNHAHEANGKYNKSCRGGRQDDADEADRKYEYEEVIQKAGTGGRQEVRGCESGIMQRIANRKYKEMNQKSCRGGRQEVREWSHESCRGCGQEVGGSETGIMQRRQT